MKNLFGVITTIFCSVLFANGQPAAPLKDGSVQVKLVEVVCSSTNPASAQMNVMFDNSLASLPNDLRIENINPAIYRIINLDNGTIYPLPAPTMDAVFNNTLNFDVVTGIRPDQVKIGFGLIANNHVRTDGENDIVSSLTKISFSDLCKSPPLKLPKPTDESAQTAPNKPFFDYFKKAEDEDNAKFKMNFSIDGTKTTRRYFTNETKFQPIRIHKLGLGGAYDVIPAYVNFKYSGNPENPEDVLEFGAKLNHFRVFHDDGRRISEWKADAKLIAGIATSFNPRIETDRKFEQINFVFGWKSGLPLNIIQTRSHTLRIKPYIGFELGRVLKAPADFNDVKLIARPLIGATLFYSPFRRAERQLFAVEGSYVRRFLLKPERFYVIDANGEEVIGGVSKRPRDYTNIKLIFNKGGIFSPYLEYSYGREPTKYILTNSRYQAGLQMSFDWNK